MRIAQRLPAVLYWGALGLSGVLAVMTMVLADQVWTVRAGAFSALAAAFAAAGFVLHAQPRILRKRWSDLYWAPELQSLIDAKLIDYESEATGVWVIKASEHRKGRVPLLRITERRSEVDPWQEWLVDYQVSSQGDVSVLVGVARDRVDAGKDVRAIIS